MGEFILFLATALALVFVIEGLIYALFPEQIKAYMRLALELPPAQFRVIGGTMAAIGFIIVWLLSLF